MQILSGPNAVSAFRLDKYLNQLQTIHSDVYGLSGQFFHVIESSSELSQDSLNKLMRLLDYGSPASATQNSYEILILPRAGTQSPWSSKALDIAHNSGLEQLLHLERGIAWRFECSSPCDDEQRLQLAGPLYDRMTEQVFLDQQALEAYFAHQPGESFTTIALSSEGKASLEAANQQLGLALSDSEIDYLYQSYQRLGRDPSDVELMMFAQANSEHCRHKIFNAAWTIDQQTQEKTLFGMIRETHQANPGRVLSAYHDNAAVTRGYPGQRFFPGSDHHYAATTETCNILMKVETHNHPTAISPLPGAATGSGGEIRDEAATGRGGKPKAGLCGFSVSNLLIPEQEQAWEQDYGKPSHMVSALEIMLEGPIGAAAYNNEFGRPGLCGYFRTYEQHDPASERVRGYHKPIMIAGGFGLVRDAHVDKKEIPPEALLIVLGGPAMLIGLGGGAASSVASGSSHEELDFASVQRHNPEIQRRCQEVVDRCWAMGDDNPILSIHDVGAGGLSNALPELVSDSDRGARFDLRAIPNSEPGLSPVEIWCNEAQERYVLAIHESHVGVFQELCDRERAPFAIIGRATATQQLVLEDPKFHNNPIDIPLDVLLGKLPQMQRQVSSGASPLKAFSKEDIPLEQAIIRLLNLPTIADKRFLIHIGDRSVGGLVHRDQMVGPWQMPVADCAVTMCGFGELAGEAMAMGERPALALINAPASGRIAIAEAITNLAAARIAKLGDISLSANWMAACGQLDEDSRLFATVAAVSELCQQLGICIPVGKDSLSMHSHWSEQEQAKQVTSPVSLVITAFAPVLDISQSLTPLLDTQHEDTLLVLIDLGRGQNRLGGSCLAQVYNEMGEATPDLEQAEDLISFFQAIQSLNDSGHILAYHDRSDGGLIVTLIEMALTSRSGLNIDISALGTNPLAALCAEEAGAILQIPQSSLEYVRQALANSQQLEDHLHIVGTLNQDHTLNIIHQQQTLLALPLQTLQQHWSATSYHLQGLRDNPDCAKQEYEQVCDIEQPGLFVDTSFELKPPPAIHHQRPKVAILREQGVNGQIEMAAAFDRAGFDAIDVHMSDIQSGRETLENIQGIAACGGFSYGDVLGAGGGWAKSILMMDNVRQRFADFFQRPDTFALGVCNGCQMMSQLRELIPGTQHWPDFQQNTSEQFEARLVMVEVTPSPSIFFSSMAGSRLPIVVAHGEGRVEFPQTSTLKETHCMKYIDHQGNATEKYPANPNGSVGGLTGICSEDGRFTILMPHPERVFLRHQFSWFDRNWKDLESPWMQMFYNARNWLK